MERKAHVKAISVRPVIDKVLPDEKAPVVHRQAEETMEVKFDEMSLSAPGQPTLEN